MSTVAVGQHSDERAAAYLAVLASSVLLSSPTVGFPERFLVNASDVLDLDGAARVLAELPKPITVTALPFGPSGLALCTARIPARVLAVTKPRWSWDAGAPNPDPRIQSMPIVYRSGTILGVAGQEWMIVPMVGFIHFESNYHWADLMSREGPPNARQWNHRQGIEARALASRAQWIADFARGAITPSDMPDVLDAGWARDSLSDHPVADVLH